MTGSQLRDSPALHGQESTRLILHHFAAYLHLSQAGSSDSLCMMAAQHGLELQLLQTSPKTSPGRKQKHQHKHKRKRHRVSLSDQQDSDMGVTGRMYAIDARAGGLAYHGEVANLGEAAACACAVFVQHLSLNGSLS